MFLTDLLTVFAAAGLVVYIFQLLRLPTVVGLLVAGVIVGPHSLGLVEETESVKTLAEVGIVVLLFAVGLEFSLSRVLAMSRLMLMVGVPQVGICIAVTTGVAYLIGGDWRPALFAGMLVAMSSTAVVIKVLADRGELDAPHGRVSVAVLLLQDLLVVAFVLAVPMLAKPVGDGPGEVIPMAREHADEPAQVSSQPPLQALVLGIATVTVILLAGKYLLPKVLFHVVRTRNRELFLIVIFLVCIGTASLTGAVGLSLALGAFLAGLTLSESEYGHQTLAEVMPFRDTLSSLFFVSVGMLLDIGFVVNHLPTVLAIVAGLLLLKFAAAAGPTALAGMPVRVVLTTGLALAQIGEFSFILAESGRQVGLMTADQYQAFLAAAW